MIALAALADAYGWSSARIVARASERVFRVLADGREVAIKAFEPADADVAKREAALLTHLGERRLRGDERVRVQTIVSDARGAATDGAVVVTAWEPGVQRTYDAIDEATWRALGVALAALHDRLDGFDAVPLPKLVVRDVDAVHDARRALATGVTSTDVLAWLDLQREVLDVYGPRAAADAPSRGAPIHDDYNQYNYLFAEGRPPLVLDWEAAIVAPREYEVVRCLNHLPIVAPRHARAFLAGYRSVRSLDEGALAWAVAAAMTDHATKRWPLERWLAGDENAMARIRGSHEVLRAMWTHREALEAFFR